MASNITITLTKKKHSPWGLLTETDPPQQIIWLTEKKMQDSVPYRLLTSNDIDRIQYAVRCGVITVEGLEDSIPAAAPQAPTKVNISPQTAQQILDMAALLQGTPPVKYEDIAFSSAPESSEKERPISHSLLNLEEPQEGNEAHLEALITSSIEEVNISESEGVSNNEVLEKQEHLQFQAEQSFIREVKDIEARISQKSFVEEKEEEAALRQAKITEKYNSLLEKKENNPFLLNTLDQKAFKVRRAIKILARGRIPLDTFRNLLKLEEKGKKRKSIIKDLREIIESRLASITEDIPSPGKGGLESTYADLIEEEEEGGIEIHFEPLPFS